MKATKITKEILFETTKLEVSGVLVTNEDSSQEFEIESVNLCESKDITTLLEYIDAFYVENRLESLRMPELPVKSIWDKIEEIILKKINN